MKDGIDDEGPQKGEAPDIMGIKEVVRDPGFWMVWPVKRWK